MVEKQISMLIHIAMMYAKNSLEMLRIEYLQKNRICLVHNGTIDNYSVLKKDLQEKSVAFKSETDTEVIANLIGWV